MVRADQQKPETKGLKKLKKWLKANEYSPAEGARQIGVSRQTLHKWLRGGKLERTSAMLIEKTIAIPADDFFD